DRIQAPLNPHWGTVTPFALQSDDQFSPPAPEPFLLDSQAVTDLAAGTLTRTDGTILPITKALIGTDINPTFIAQAERVVAASADLSTSPAGETQKLIAEFWEDPSGTPYPPGTWMLFGQKVAEQTNPDLDADVALFFNLGNAVMDAGIATWQAKYATNYVRPVRAIRELGRLGLIGEDIDNDGLHEIDAWAGPGLGTQTIHAIDFLTYQTPGSDPSPPCPEYTSGHSAFSAAAAEVLNLYTGSDDFVLGDGTLGLSVSFSPGISRFEPGVTPANDTLELSWLTFSEAADEAGISRIYGGIHFDDGDLNGRQLGRQIGEEVFARTSQLLSGLPTSPAPSKSVPEPGTLLGLLVMSGLAYRVRSQRSKPEA
ncbi:MAG: vanadium-dependent haloperoxidase, partial [Cyanobacteria bacterium P01_F01_bin.4]